VAFCLKESLGSVLSKLMDVFLASEKEFKADKPKYIVFECRLSAEEDPIKVGVPFRALGEQLLWGRHRLLPAFRRGRRSHRNGDRQCGRLVGLHKPSGWARDPHGPYACRRHSRRHGTTPGQPACALT
jgi:hypothetical protein